MTAKVRAEVLRRQDGHEHASDAAVLAALDNVVKFGRACLPGDELDVDREIVYDAALYEAGLIEEIPGAAPDAEGDAPMRLTAPGRAERARLTAALKVAKCPCGALVAGACTLCGVGPTETVLGRLLVNHNGHHVYCGKCAPWHPVAGLSYLSEVRLVRMEGED